jgi:ABC-type transporter Mla maintaining outer membrane lipid asymmetry permease subunit MlaE
MRRPDPVLTALVVAGWLAAAGAVVIAAMEAFR